MSAKNTLLQFAYMLIPVIIFRIAYGYFGIVAAIASSLTITVGMMAYNYKKKGRIGNMLIISLVLTILSFISYLLSSNENFYFIPSILQTVVFVILVLYFIIRKKCFVFLLIKDFNIPYIDKMDEKEFLSLNYIWLFLLLLRLAIKIISLTIAGLSFETLYWISFLSGDPITLPVIYYTYRFFRKKIKTYYNETYKTAP